MTGILDWSHARTGGIGGSWFHSSVKTVSRSSGRSAVASCAYRTGERLTDLETDLAHDFRGRSGVVTAFSLAPENAPAWAMDTERLWNEAQAADTRKNSRTAREVELALPASVGDAEREAIVRAFAQEIVDRYGVAITAAIHEPGKGSDLNHHAHLQFTTRRLDATGFGEKTRELDDRKTGPEEIAWLRGRACELINEALAASGSQERVDHRSFGTRGIDKEATIHLGPKAAAMERSGRESERGTSNREAADRNNLDQLVAELAELDAQIAAELDAEIVALEEKPLDARYGPAGDPSLEEPRLEPDRPADVAARAEAAPEPVAGASADITAPDREQRQAAFADYLRPSVEAVEQTGETSTGAGWWENLKTALAHTRDAVVDMARDMRESWRSYVERDRGRDIDPPDMS
jgi:hypothetical protein